MDQRETLKKERGEGEWWAHDSMTSSEQPGDFLSFRVRLKRLRLLHRRTQRLQQLCSDTGSYTATCYTTNRQTRLQLIAKGTQRLQQLAHTRTPFTLFSIIVAKPRSSVLMSIRRGRPKLLFRVTTATIFRLHANIGRRYGEFSSVRIFLKEAIYVPPTEI